MAKGSLTVVVHVKVPRAGQDRIKSAKERRWIDMTATIATVDECDYDEATRLVAAFRTRNKHLTITGEWLGRMEV